MSLGPPRFVKSFVAKSTDGTEYTIHEYIEQIGGATSSTGGKVAYIDGVPIYQDDNGDVVFTVGEGVFDIKADHVYIQVTAVDNS